MTTEAQRRSLIRQMAINEHVDGGRTEIHTDAEISEGGDNGAYVQAWVWVSFAGTELDKEDPSTKDVWIAGYNMPGYMPDDEPAEFDSFDEAKREIIYQLKISEEQAVTESDAEAFCHFAEDVNLQSCEFSVQCGKYVYWVRKETK